MSWYAILAEPRCAQRAQAALTERGFKVYLPMETRWRRKRGEQRERMQTPLFGSYLFVEVPEERFYDLNTTEGVSRVIGVAGVPRPLPTDWITSLRTQEASGFFDRTQNLKRTFHIGQGVRIMRGVFTGYTAAVIGQLSPEGRVKIMLQAIAGSRAKVNAAPITVNADHLEPA